MKVKIHVDRISLKRVTLNMNRAIAGITLRSRSGLIAAGIHVLGAAIENCPYATRNLAHSGTVIWDKSAGNNNTFISPGGGEVKADTDKMVAEVKGTLKSNINLFDVGIGFGASYAVFVHENLEAHHDHGSAQFLTKAMRDEQDEVLKLIKSYAKVR